MGEGLGAERLAEAPSEDLRVGDVQASGPPASASAWRRDLPHTQRLHLREEAGVDRRRLRGAGVGAGAWAAGVGARPGHRAAPGAYDDWVAAAAETVAEPKPEDELYNMPSWTHTAFDSMSEMSSVLYSPFAVR